MSKLLNHFQNFRKIQFSSTKTRYHGDIPVESKKAIVYSMDEITRFITECLNKAGCAKENSEIVAKCLVKSDYRGVMSHGLNRLERYIKEIMNGICDGKAKPEVVKQTEATALINGKNGLGQLLGTYGMGVAIEKAKKCGIGMTCVYDAGHFGVSSLYALQAMDAGTIGIVMTNTSPLMVPFGARDVALGTNPISIGAKGDDDDEFVLDISTTAVSVGQIELRNKLGKPIPKGWALNEEGKPETEPAKVLKKPRLTPLGNDEENSGYKGYGLALAIDMLSGLLAGSDYGPYIRKYGKNDVKFNVGYSFISIDPNCFGADFKRRLHDLLNYLRSMTPANPEKPVLVAGDKERLNMKKVNAAGGITYNEKQIEICKKLAETLHIKPMQPL